MFQYGRRACLSVNTVGVYNASEQHRSGAKFGMLWAASNLHASTYCRGTSMEVCSVSGQEMVIDKDKQMTGLWGVTRIHLDLHEDIAPDDVWDVRLTE